MKKNARYLVLLLLCLAVLGACTSLSPSVPPAPSVPATPIASASPNGLSRSESPSATGTPVLSTPVVPALVVIATRTPSPTYPLARPNGTPVNCPYPPSPAPNVKYAREIDLDPQTPFAGKSTLLIRRANGEYEYVMYSNVVLEDQYLATLMPGDCLAGTMPPPCLSTLKFGTPCPPHATPNPNYSMPEYRAREVALAVMERAEGTKPGLSRLTHPVVVTDAELIPLGQALPRIAPDIHPQEPLDQLVWLITLEGNFTWQPAFATPHVFHHLLVLLGAYDGIPNLRPLD